VEANVMAARRILVVEDDAAIRQGVCDALRFEGYEPVEAATFEEARRAGTRGGVDLILLDLVLPGGSGLKVLEAVRAARPTLPVVILTALGREDDRVAGLKLGADDYVVKPFSVKELLARVAAVLRRSAERPADVAEVSFPGGEADVLRREVRFDDGGRAELTEREAELLRYLAANAGRAVSRAELLEQVWHLPASAVHTRTIDMQVARLRDKLRDGEEEPKLVLTVRGLGYMLARPAKEKE
jgi:DNA-binding response OmpR family regulator